MDNLSCGSQMDGWMNGLCKFEIEEGWMDGVKY